MNPSIVGRPSSNASGHHSNPNVMVKRPSCNRMFKLSYKTNFSEATSYAPLVQVELYLVGLATYRGIYVLNWRCVVAEHQP